MTSISTAQVSRSNDQKSEPNSQTSQTSGPSSARLAVGAAARLYLGVLGGITADQATAATITNDATSKASTALNVTNAVKTSPEISQKFNAFKESPAYAEVALQFANKFDTATLPTKLSEFDAKLIKLMTVGIPAQNASQAVAKEMLTAAALSVAPTSAPTNALTSASMLNTSTNMGTAAATNAVAGMDPAKKTALYQAAAELGKELDCDYKAANSLSALTKENLHKKAAAQLAKTLDAIPTDFGARRELASDFSTNRAGVLKLVDPVFLSTEKSLGNTDKVAAGVIAREEMHKKLFGADYYAAAKGLMAQHVSNPSLRGPMFSSAMTAAISNLPEPGPGMTKAEWFERTYNAIGSTAQSSVFVRPDPGKIGISSFVNIQIGDGRKAPPQAYVDYDMPKLNEAPNKNATMKEPAFGAHNVIDTPAEMQQYQRQQQIQQHRNNRGTGFRIGF